jgi:hypothetical protein
VSEQCLCGLASATILAVPKKWSQLQAKMSPERRARNEAKTKEMLYKLRMKVEKQEFDSVLNKLLKTPPLKREEINKGKLTAAKKSETRSRGKT